MSEKLTNLISDEVKDVVKDNLVNNIGINKADTDSVVKAGTGSIFESLKEELMEGDFQAVMNIFKTQAGDMLDNPMIKNIISKASGKLSAAQGLDLKTSEDVVKSTLPAVMDNLGKKDADDSPFSIASMLNMLKGDGDEDGLLGSITSKITRGLGNIGGFFK